MRPLPPEWFTQNRVDTVLIRTSEAIQDPLLTGFTNLYPTDFTFFFIQSPQRKHFICGHMEKGAVKKNYRGPLTVIQKKSDWVRALKPFMRGKRVGINLPYLTAAQLANLKKEFPRTRFTDVSGALEETRKIKEKDEQKKLMEGARITQEVLHGMHHVVKTGMKEIELAAEIDHQFHKNGCTNSFSTIVAFGKNSRNIHHYNSSAKLRKGDVILMDAGARYQGYCADLSRTFVFGNATSEQEKWYALCHRALQEGMRAIFPGEKGKKAFAIAEKTLGKKIPHALGHGIGLETHDVPSGIGPSAEWAFEKDMCLAVEPGYYGKTFGIRIEENGMVTREGFKPWSKAPKRLVVW